MAQKPKTLTYEITEEDVGRAACDVFFPHYPTNGWAAEITQKHVGMRVHCSPSVFAPDSAFIKPKRRWED